MSPRELAKPKSSPVHQRLEPQPSRHALFPIVGVGASAGGAFTPVPGDRSMFREERRSERRYPIRQPAFVKFQAEERGEVETVAQNVSTRGLLLRSETLIPVRSKMEVGLCFPNALPLEGAGEVLRVEQPSAGRVFLIAVRCTAPWKFSR
jgi:PilZ domain